MRVFVIFSHHVMLSFFGKKILQEKCTKITYSTISNGSIGTIVMGNFLRKIRFFKELPTQVLTTFLEINNLIFLP